MIRFEAEPIRPPVRTLSEIERDDVVRRSLEEAAAKIEKLSGNQVYSRAWEIAAKLVRAMKP